jgi:hypothetical protein
MFLWRLKQFLGLWLRFFASGESKWGKARKVIGLVIFMGLLPYTLRDISFLVYLQPATGSYTEVRLGLLVFIIATAAWALLSAGRAYELAGVPNLRVGTELERDRDVSRLPLLCEQKYFETTVWLREVFNADGTRHLPGRFPLELERTHKPKESRVHLTKGVPASVSVAQVNYSTSGRVGMLFCTGAQHPCPLEIVKGKSVYFWLWIEHATRKPIERWFRFERTDDAEFMAFPVTQPPFTPQAIPAMSKRVR